MNIRRVAQIVLYDDKHRILLQDREGYKKGMKWGCFGGKIEEGDKAIITSFVNQLGL